MTPHFCHDCARPTKGNYSQCEVCGAPICDACDRRLLHPNSCYCHDHLPSKRGRLVMILAHCTDKPGSKGDASEAFSSTFQGEAGRVIDWAFHEYGPYLELRLPCTVKVGILITADVDLAALFRNWVGFEWQELETHDVLIPGNYAADDSYDENWVKENKA